MTQRQYTNALAEVSLKWRDLAERRRAHLVELYDTGRWKLYYEDDQFLNEMRAAIMIAHRWARIAPRPGDQPQPAE